MPRQVRIEIPGAMYHVMASDNHKAAIVYDDEDRKTFIRTLATACRRTGLSLEQLTILT